MNKLQESILSVALKLDEICKKHDINYCIMGGTALGAIRHGGFIPWDDDIDVFMTPSDFEKFRTAVELEGGDYFVETVGLSQKYVEYAKFKKKNTTFIEGGTINFDGFSHNVFVDIMLIRKCPNSPSKRKRLYKMSQLVSFLTIIQTGWQPKKKFHKFAQKVFAFLPKKFIAERCLKKIIKYESLENFTHYCYFMSRVKYEQGLFKKELFSSFEQIPFENTTLLAPCGIKEYLSIRYGDYMALPPEDKRVGEHAFFFDGDKSYEEYIQDFGAKYAILSFRRQLNAECEQIVTEGKLVIERGTAYTSDGEITKVEDLKLPLRAVLVQSAGDMRIMRRMLAKMKKATVCVFDIAGGINKKTLQSLVKTINKYSVQTVTLDTLKQKLHGTI